MSYFLFDPNNVSKLLSKLSVAQCYNTIKSLAYETEVRLRDPILVMVEGLGTKWSCSLLPWLLEISRMLSLTRCNNKRSNIIPLRHNFSSHRSRSHRDNISNNSVKAVTRDQQSCYAIVTTSKSKDPRLPSDVINNQVDLPLGWKLLNLEHYNGTTDLDEHLDVFLTQENLYTNDDAFLCRLFPMTLREKH
ncbi:hypothetical protein JHK82_047895 [Glycine max]|nr:hypothetical protein JHK82_047895 [Glycine max]